MPDTGTVDELRGTESPTVADGKRNGPGQPLHKVRTCLWFADQALPAAEFYCSLLPGSRIEKVAKFPEGQEIAEPGSVLTVDFVLCGTPYQALNGGPHYKLSPAASVSVLTDDQDETDRLWNALTADGGSEMPCGWLTDRFGLSWQITPRRLLELVSGPAAEKVWQAMMPMTRIDIAALEAAAEAG